MGPRHFTHSPQQLVRLRQVAGGVLGVSSSPGARNPLAPMVSPREKPVAKGMAATISRPSAVAQGSSTATTRPDTCDGRTCQQRCNPPAEPAGIALTALTTLESASGSSRPLLSGGLSPPAATLACEGPKSRLPRVPSVDNGSAGDEVVQRATVTLEQDADEP